MIAKCLECGNTFRMEKFTSGDLIVCPVCEADYKVEIKDGKVKLQAHVYENEEW